MSKRVDTDTGMTYGKCIGLGYGTWTWLTTWDGERPYETMKRDKDNRLREKKKGENQGRCKEGRLMEIKEVSEMEVTRGC